ncbi:prolipoprotein diacylglyceryl transferase [candidate division Kazan bacterium]|uniref:Phosphatidylglycerol--prolipoprotein diacylglyceryl transferase n=1 Tax=candidate division Kazan bacterium TaxID=2202143 RepID=A0A420ZCN9_UNCK3|nr:MAG: prolipoprotein diacylglyceryl transferase [candidate division Kazan bacterium]
MDKKFLKYALGATLIVVIYFILAPYFAGDKIVDAVAFEVGPVSVRWYGMLIALSILIGYFVVVRSLAGSRNLNADLLLNVVIWGLVGGIVGARLMFVILKWPLYIDNLAEIVLITQGGLSIHGAILGGALTTLWATKIYKLDFKKVADVFVPAIILGQAIGRFGNFFNQEAFGGPTNLPWKMYVSPQSRPLGLEEFTHFHPTFLYEAVGSFIIFFILLRLLKLRLKDGGVLAWYLILYSSLRFAVEFVRIDSDHWWFLTIAQWASLAIIALSVWWLRQKSPLNQFKNRDE